MLLNTLAIVATTMVIISRTTTTSWVWDSVFYIRVNCFAEVATTIKVRRAGIANLFNDLVGISSCSHRTNNCCYRNHTSELYDTLS